ncbi:MAG: hypothetical protein H8D23_39845 [Candidatus Brocadiales bacterium]|nr:hypothetical protein [Candidatus Brocadiales bacterium]
MKDSLAFIENGCLINRVFVVSSGKNETFEIFAIRSSFCHSRENGQAA